MRNFIFCRTFFYTLFLFLCTLLCLSTCRQPTIPFFGTHEKVVLKIPQPDFTYLLFIDETGTARKSALSPGEGELRLVVAKNRVTPFLFYTGEADTCPVGCIYPYDTASDKAGGFTAFVLYRLFICSENEEQKIYERISLFNWAKLKESVTVYEEPWKLDDALIAKKIAAGTFNSRHIKKKVQ